MELYAPILCFKHNLLIKTPIIDQRQNVSELVVAQVLVNTPPTKTHRFCDNSRVFVDSPKM